MNSRQINPLNSADCFKTALSCQADYLEGFVVFDVYKTGLGLVTVMLL